MKPSTLALPLHPHFPRFRPIGKFLLAINGIYARTVEEVSGCFRFHLERKHSGLDSLTLLLMSSMCVGEHGSDKVGQLCVVFGIDFSGAP